jgi:hypothetical protein
LWLNFNFIATRGKKAIAEMNLLYPAVYCTVLESPDGITVGRSYSNSALTILISCGPADSMMLAVASATTISENPATIS